MDILAQQLVPFKGASYFTAYSNTRRRIQVEGNAGRRRAIIRLCLVVATEIAYNIYLTFRPVLSPASQTMHFAVFHLAGLSSTLYLVPAFAEVLALYYFYLLYLDPGNENTYWSGERSGRQFIYDVTLTHRRSKRLLLLVVNVLQIFTLFVGKDFLLKII